MTVDNGAEHTGKRVSILIGQHGARLYQAGNLRSASQSLVIVPFKVADPCIFNLPTRPHESTKQPSREAASVSGLVRRGIVARRSADSVLPPRTEPGGAS